MTRYGFTGTQQGMSSPQAEAFARLIRKGDEVHHGDCVGADADADVIARAKGATVVLHPPTDPKKRAFMAQEGDESRDPRPYLERNHDIVDETEALVAAPRSDAEEVRSGTWATVRYARSVGREVLVLPR